MSLPVSAPPAPAGAGAAGGGSGGGGGTSAVQGGPDAAAAASGPSGGCKWRSGPEQLASVHQVRFGAWARCRYGRGDA